MASRVLKIALVPVISLLMAACNQPSKLPYYNTPDFTPHWLSTVPDTFHKVANFNMLDQQGHTITLDSFAGDVMVVNFFFTTCPGICPKMTGNLKTAATAFASRDDVKFLSFSVTPEVDSVPRLKAYAADNNINPAQWHLLTGNKTIIYGLARKAFFAEEEGGYNADSTEFLHTEHVLLVDKNKRLRGVYNGTVALEVKRLREDITLLLAEDL